MAYVLVFKGRLEPSISQETAAELIAERLGKDPSVIANRLFTGKTVPIACVPSRAEAERYVGIFFEAGVWLEVHRRETSIDVPGADDFSIDPDARYREDPAPQATVTPVESAPPETAPIDPPLVAEPLPDADPLPARGAEQPVDDADNSSPPRSRGLRYGLAAAAVVLLAVVAGGAWYTSPAWMNTPVSDDRLRVANALASRDVIGIVHADVARTLRIEERLTGTRDAGALRSADDTWDSLIEAGIDPADIDDVVAASYAGATGMHWTVAITGQIDSQAVQAWIANRFDVERTGGDTVFFSWLDEQRCEQVPMKAARIGPSRIVITDADRIDEVWARIQSGAPAEVAIDDWIGMTGRQLVTLGIMNPAGMDQAADGMAGMMLAAASQAMMPAEAVYFGVAPTLAPPGVVLTSAMTSDNAGFLDLVHTSASNWLDEVRSTIADEPEVLDLVNRITFERDGRMVTAGIRFDTNVDEELETLIGGVVERSMGFSSAGGTAGVVQERLDENPTRFGNASIASLPRYDQFGTSFNEPQWQDGPFALSVSRLSVTDDGAMQVALRGEGRGLPNLGDRAKLVRMRVNDVTDATGNSMLPPAECGPDASTAWRESGPAVQNSYFDTTNVLRYYSLVSFDRSVALAEGAVADDVAAIHGEIEYQMPVQVRSVRVNMPVAGEIVQTDDVRIRFSDNGPHTIAYKVSGDTSRLLEVRGLNEQGAVLDSSSSMSSGSWFGSGESVSIDIQGTVAAVEVVIADAVETVSYDFELPTAYPSIDDSFSAPLQPFDVAQPGEVYLAMQSAAPEVSFDWNPPVASATAGPAFVAVNDLQATSFMGLRARLEVYVPDSMPLADHLNGGTVQIDAATLPDGSSIPLEFGGPVALRTDGGYWSNGEYVPDPDRPWLKGDADLQMLDYELDTPVAVDGRVIFRAPVETQTWTLPAEPGSQIERDGVSLVVSEWQANNIDVEINDGAERILSIVALDADGNQASRVTRLAGAADDLEARVGNLVSRPTTLQVMIATETTDHEVPFTVTLDADNRQASSGLQ